MILTMTMAVALAAQVNQATPPRRARANLSQYFSTDDYPLNALARGAQGTAGFRLWIGTDGAVTGCTINHSSGDAALDAATCAILLGRARYEPARDAAGRAVPGKDYGRVTWRLPPPLPGMPFALRRTVSRLSADGAGALSCAVTSNGVAEPDTAPSRCGALAYSGADYWLRRAPAPTEVTMVSVAGPMDAGADTAGADEAGYGALQYELVVDLTIGQNGRVAGCRLVRRNAPMPAPVPTTTPDLCELPPAGAPPMFEPSTNPARRARYRSALYIKGWTGGLQAPAEPAVTPGPPPRP
jgi:TonB family protein